MALIEQELGVSEMLDWLRNELDSRNITARIARERVRERTEYAYLDERKIVYHFVFVPIFVENEDPEESPGLLVQLMEAWNSREPAPEKRLFLYPGQVPDGVV